MVVEISFFYTRSILVNFFFH